MDYPKLAWNRSPAKERNRNRSCLGWWPISFLVFLIPLRDRDLQSKAEACWCPGTCIQGQQEPQVRAESVRERSSRELKHTECSFCLSKLDSLSCFCYSEAKNIRLMCQAAKTADTPGRHHPSPHAMPGEGNQNTHDLGKSRLGFALAQHQLHLSHYTWWVFGLFQSLRKIN